MKKKAQSQNTDAEKKEVKRRRRFDRALKSCMHCKYFYGSSSQCINKKCIKEKKVVREDGRPEKCKGCPYYREGFCFPCMKDLLERSS